MHKGEKKGERPLIGKGGKGGNGKKGKGKEGKPED